MRADDREHREVGRDGIDEDRAAVVELQAHAAGRARADARRAHVEETNHAKLGRGLVDRVVRLVVRVKALHRLLELEPAQAELMTAMDLLDAPVAILVRIDGAEPDEHVGVCAHGGRDAVVRDRGQAGVRARVLAQKHGHHPVPPVHRRGVVGRRRGARRILEVALGPLEVFTARRDRLVVVRVHVHVDGAHPFGQLHSRAISLSRYFSTLPAPLTGNSPTARNVRGTL